MPSVAQRLRWGDTIDEDDVLPPPVHRGPDENGIKTVIEYFRNDRGDTVKKTTKLKIVSVEKKVYKVTEERRNIPRFGLAKLETPQDSVTAQNIEDIPFEKVRQSKSTSQEKKVDLQNILNNTNDKQMIAGSLKDILYRKRMERELLRAKGLLKGAEKPPEEDVPGGSKSETSLPSGPPKAGSYVPPSMRNRGPTTMGDGAGPDRRREENSVRVTNLSDDVTEADLGELFRPFGHILRIYLAVDRTTGESRGFAFVTFAHREDGDRAIRTLNGYGYGHLILKVEWAAPRESRAG
ncbi:hypothetical protein CEUSTIGMA_g11479.t1 [Chlamydomonas eustigma]|uniref:Eukaryotic translation initiation factor 3 subunit G n=1 Tax=Chlamydomonas eustigma TaxID=1157962 RepID=A0A250XLS8_9CHLO|nr:hypothetical protein CEUSTIGMA_g11479.t1 [Chlamydomonas eustigma]|eukprot:GAX84055.1 hypothetical protein CEUSTIGMA_g11479.t1 [Chlamydomonas eustigma]